jgi:hypothetical protein
MCACEEQTCGAALLHAQADGRDRTGDIRFTRAVLYQLSYVGVAYASYSQAQAGSCEL